MFLEIFKEKKILITGDTGFKGSWLSIWLMSLGAKVYGYALPPKRKEDNYVACELDKKLHHVDGDIRDLKTLTDYFNNIQPDFVFHLAAQPLVLKSYDDPYETFSTNVMGVVNIFEAARNTPSVKVVINVTTDKCYQNNNWIWGYRENDRMGGEDPYSASKSASEIITTSYIKSFFGDKSTANVASVRAGNVIGAGDWAENRIIPDYFRAKISKQTLLIRNPNSTRPWQHVLEPLSGYLNLASLLYIEGKEYQGGWNFGPIDANSVLDLINQIEKDNNDVGFIIDENIKPTPEARLLQLDISKAKNELEWVPALDFESTVRYTAKGYFADMLGKSVLKNRIKTIHSYEECAKNNGIKWARK